MNGWRQRLGGIIAAVILMVTVMTFVVWLMLSYPIDH